MPRLIIFILLTGIICYPSSDARAGVFSQAETYTADTTVLCWMPLSGKFFAVTGTGIMIGNMTIATGRQEMIRILNDHYFGLLTHKGESFDQAGTQIGRLEEKWSGETALPRFMIDPADQYLISADILNRLRVYNTDGSVVMESQIFPEYRYYDENVMYTIFNTGDRHLLAGLTQVHPDPSGFPGYETIMKYSDLNGETRFILHFDGWQINAMESRPDGSMHAVSLYSYDPTRDRLLFRSLIIDGDGIITGELPVQFRILKFCGDKYILLIDKDLISIYDIKTRRITGSSATTDFGRIIMTTAYVPEKDLFLAEEGSLGQNDRGWNYTRIVFRMFDPTGRVVDAMNLDDILVYEPAMHYDPVQRQIFIGHSRGWITFNVNP
jgi:hypothetical protein